MNPRPIFAPIGALFLSLCILLSAFAQTKQTDKPTDDKDDVVKISTNLVQIDAVVTKNGKPVTNLTAEDFEIYEDGRKQDITSFAYVSNISAIPSAAPDKTAPEKNEPDPGVPAEPIKREATRRTIAIVIDDLGMSAQSAGQLRPQLKKFIAEDLQPNDLVAVIRTGGKMGALQQFTNDKRILNRAVDRLSWNPCSRLGLSTLRRVEDMRTGGCLGLTHLQITLNALRFILESMGQLPGRKSLILVSEDIPLRVPSPLPEGAQRIMVGNEDTNYGDWLQRLTETAIRSSVVIYSIDAQGVQYTGITAADAVSGRIPETRPVLPGLLAGRFRTLQERREGSLRIAKNTGGFQITNSNSLELDRILEDQSGYYLIGYRPSEETFNRKFHHITAKVKRSGMTLRTRTGFFGITEDELARSKPTVQDQTNLALLSPFGAQGIELDLTSFFTIGKTENGKAEGPIVRSFIYVNANNLTFTPVNDRHQTSLEMHGAIFGDNGSMLEQVKHTAVLSLRPSEYQLALREGLNLRLDLPAKRSGAFQVRIAVRDQNSSKIGSAGEYVAVPDLKNDRLAMSGVVLRGAAETMTPTAAMANPGTIRFAPGADLHFAFMIYNSAINPATQLPNLVMQARLFRDGKPVGTGTETAVSVAKQADLARLFTTGVVKLDRNLEPGNYYLQVVITDKTARDKQLPVTQWVDFEIVKGVS
jgi:VWFA-related protein